MLIFREMASRPIEENELKAIIESDVPVALEGFLSKTKKPFNANVVWNKESNKLEFKFS